MTNKKVFDRIELAYKKLPEFIEDLLEVAESEFFIDLEETDVYNNKGKLFIEGYRWTTEEEIADSQRDLFDDDADYFEDEAMKYDDWFENLRRKAKAYGETRYWEQKIADQSNINTADAQYGRSTLGNHWQDVVDAGQDLLAHISTFVKTVKENLENGRETRP